MDERNRRTSASKAIAKRIAPVADQALSSLSNLVISVAIARASSVSDFGAFGIAFSLYLIVLAVSRAVTGDNLLYSVGEKDANSLPGDNWLRGTPSVAALNGVVSGSAILLFTVFVPLDAGVRSMLLVFGIGFPALLLQDSLRYLAFASGRTLLAVANDAVWLAVVTVVLLLEFLRAWPLGSLGVVVVWVSGAAMSSVAVMMHGRIVPDFMFVRQYYERHWPRIRTLAPDYLLTSVASFALLPVLGVVGGVTSVAGLRGAQVLMGPVSVLSTGLSVVSVPTASRAISNGYDGRVHPVFLRTAFVVVLGFLVVGVWWSLLCPPALLTQLLGPSASASQDLVFVYAVVAALGAGAFVFSASLRLRQRGREVVFVRVGSSLASLVLAALGMALGGPLLALIGMLCGAVLALAALVFASLVTPRSRQS